MLLMTMNALELLVFMVNEEHKFINQLLDLISDEQLDISLGTDVTIRSRLQHMAGAEFRMAGYLVKQKDEFEADYQSIDGIRNAFEKSKQHHLSTLSQLKEADLLKIWKSERTGKDYEYRWLLYHFLEHLSTHRGQIAMALRSS